MRWLFWTAAAAAVATTVASADVAADEFYTGKRVTLVVGYGTGGGYSLYAQVLVDHLGRHLPGKPTVVPQFMPGGGTVKATNFLYKAAAQDGSVIGMVSETLTILQLIDRRQLRADMSKFNWIGRMGNMNAVLFVRSDAPATALDSMKTTEVVLADTGRGSPTNIYPTLMNQMVGTKFKIVSGYPGSAEMDLSIERGETQGRTGAWISLKAQRSDWFSKGFVRPVVEIALSKSGDLPNLPLLKDLGRTPDDRKALAFMSVGATIGRAILAPPGVPSDRVSALRAAFDATMRDPAYLSDARKRKVEIDALGGAALQKIVADAVDTPKTIVSRIQSVLGISP